MSGSQSLFLLSFDGFQSRIKLHSNIYNYSYYSIAFFPSTVDSIQIYTATYTKWYHIQDKGQYIVGDGRTYKGGVGDTN